MNHLTRLVLTMVGIVWPTLFCSAQASTAQSGVPDAGAETAGLLAKKMPEMRFDTVPLADVIDFFRDRTGANIFVNWRSLEGVGIDRSVPITLRLRDVSLEKAIRTVLDDVGAGNVRLDFVVDQGVITISTEDDITASRAHPSPARPGEYFVSGVARTGVYSLTNRQITLRQALIGGGIEDPQKKHLLLVRRDDADGINRTNTILLDERLSATELNDAVRSGDVLMVADGPPPAKGQHAANLNYKIEGVTRPGTHSCAGQKTSLLQALIAAGENPPEIPTKVIRIYRDLGDGEKPVYRCEIGELIDSPTGGATLEPGDRVVVSDH